MKVRPSVEQGSRNRFRKGLGLLRSFIESREFALYNFILVIGSGIYLYVWPQTWTWALLIPSGLWILRSLVKQTLYLHPVLVGSLFVFVLTAAIGYRVAYDETAAWNKLCLILVAVLLFIVIAGQPVENLKILAGFGFVFGVGVASYFLLTSDFSTQAVKFQWIHQLGVRWMMVRPDFFQLPSIYPNDAAGIMTITAAYGLPFLSEFRGNKFAGYILRLVVFVALGIVLFAFVLASSRGAMLGLAGATSIWFMWRLLLQLRSPLQEKVLGLFPNVVLAFILLLEFVVLFVPSGLLGSSFSVGENVFVSRAEVFRSGLMILRDFPFTGGGLASFPGLYSQYVLVLPFYSLPHSHNMFLDVMIEQGVIGGFSFLLIYAISLKQLLSTLKDNRATQLFYFAACASIFTAIFHAMVDDYLYGSSGPTLALVPAGMAILVSRLGFDEKPLPESKPVPIVRRSPILSLRSFVWSIGAAFLIGLTWNSVAAQWYANLGAVKMARLDLVDYPSGTWREGTDVSAWHSAELDFRRALDYDPENQTANHRLGLIKMLARDFESGSDYLLKAYEKDSTNRGVIKNLGYSYLWLGETGKAEIFLSRIPEAKHELENYTWWWDDQGRQDLAKHAAYLSSRIGIANNQP